MSTLKGVLVMFLVPVYIHITATVTPDGSADFCCLLVLLRHRQCLSAGISPKIIVQFSANLVILPVIVFSIQVAFTRFSWQGIIFRKNSRNIDSRSIAMFLENFYRILVINSVISMNSRNHARQSQQVSCSSV